MATFPSIAPTYGAQKSSQPRVRQAQFGDGYSQRIRFGLHQNPKRWNLTWEVSETDSDTIEAFLDARADDGDSFDWTPPDSATSARWICYEWNKTVPYYNRASITATFTQVFEP
jgi:phage-related protein